MVTAVTNLGRSGLSDWLVQRTTAVILLAYFVFIGAVVFTGGAATFEQWDALFDQTWMRIFSLLAILSLASHTWIGWWGISTDYFTERLLGANGNVIRLAFQAFGAIVLFVYVVWSIEILWS